jgi:hypothetical protein
MNIGSIHHKEEERGETYFTGGRLFLLYANTWTGGASESRASRKSFYLRHFFMLVSDSAMPWNLIIYVSAMIKAFLALRKSPGGGGNF